MGYEISVIVPAFNSERYISRALRSLNDQTFKHFELIVVNDGSTDNTEKVARKTLEHSNLHYRVLSQDNGGVSSARNLGLSYAEGDYIFFLDSDDYITEVTLELLHKTALRTNSDIVFGGFDIVSNDGDLLRSYDSKYRYLDKVENGRRVANLMLKDRVWLTIGSTVFSAQIIKSNKIKFTEGCTNGEDPEFTIKVLMNSSRVASEKTSLLRYVKTDLSASQASDVRLFHSIGAYQRLLKYIQCNNFSLELEDYLKYEVIPRNIISVFAHVSSNAFKNESILKLMSHPSIRRKLIGALTSVNSSLRTKTLSIVFLIFPKLFLLLADSRRKKRL
ncbi:putative Glycosyl transferase family 2 [Mesotoga infera]|nr:putative Glycosyl transferase family 2 [Mesotoga infera]